MILECLVVGEIQSNCYVVGCEKTLQGMIVDPGGNARRIAKCVRENNLTPVYLVNTHGHVDHMLDNAAIKKEFPEIKICVHAADRAMLVDPASNLSSFFCGAVQSPPPDILLNEGDTLSMGRYKFKIIHVPGHTQGGICLYCEKPADGQPPMLISGDTLFNLGIGRTDFPGGSYSQLIKGIKSKILTLPDNTVVLPGHGPATTVGQEKVHNPFLA